MRTSNYLFTKGSIVFVKVPPTSEKAFLNGRPLIVVANPSHILKSLIVCTTGTQDKPGIRASFFNHVDKCYVGDAEVSNIYPYSLMTIYTDDIVATIGQLDPFIMTELDKAIDFHLGRTVEVPKYLSNCRDELTGVSYNQMDEKFIKHESVSKDFIPAVNYKKQYRKSEDMKSLDNSKESKHYQPSKRESFQECKKISDIEIEKWLSEPVSDIDYGAIRLDSALLYKHLGTESVLFICSRIVTLTSIAYKYNINKSTASQLRNTLTSMLIKKGSDLLNTTAKISATGNLSDSYILGLILAKEFAKVAPKNNILSTYSDDMNRVINKYRINFKDKRIWKSSDKVLLNAPSKKRR